MISQIILSFSGLEMKKKQKSRNQIPKSKNVFKEITKPQAHTLASLDVLKSVTNLQEYIFYLKNSNPLDVKLSFLTELLNLGFKFPKDGTINDVVVPSNLEEDQILLLFKLFEVLSNINNTLYLAVVIGRFLFDREAHIEKLPQNFIDQYITLLMTVSDFEGALKITINVKILLQNNQFPDPQKDDFEHEILLKYLILLQKSPFLNHHQIISTINHAMQDLSDEQNKPNTQSKPHLMGQYLMLLLKQHMIHNDLDHALETYKNLSIYLDKFGTYTFSEKFRIEANNMIIMLFLKLEKTNELLLFYENLFEAYHHDFRNDRIIWVRDYLDILKDLGQSEKYEQKVNEFRELFWTCLKEDIHGDFDLMDYIYILKLQQEIQLKSKQIQAFQDRLKEVLELILNEDWIELLDDIDVEFNLIESLLQTLLYLREDEIFEHFVFENKSSRPSQTMPKFSIELSLDSRFPFHIYLSPKIYRQYYALYLIFHKNEHTQAKDILSFDLATVNKSSNEYLQLKLISYFSQAKTNQIKISTLSKAMNDFSAYLFAKTSSIPKNEADQVAKSIIKHGLTDDMKFILFKSYFDLVEAELS
jgi:hypothetical protein